MRTIGCALKKSGIHATCEAHHMIWLYMNQVPLLLSIGEEDSSLVKATESGDTDLVFLVLFHIWQKVLLLCMQACAYLFMYLRKHGTYHTFSSSQSYRSF